MNDLRLLTSQEMQDIPAFLSPDEIKRYGFVALATKPIPMKCPLCHKWLRFMGARSLYRNTIIRWKDKPEKCECEKFKNNKEAVPLGGIIKMEIPDRDGDGTLTVYEESASGELLLFCIDESKEKLGSAATGLSVLVDKNEFLELFSRLLGISTMKDKPKPEPKPWEAEINWD